MTPRILLSILVQYTVCALLLFIPAGTAVWPAGWLLLLLMGGFSVAATVLSARRDSGLMRERMRVFQPDQKRWDKLFTALSGLLSIVLLVLVPLDAVRYRWSEVPAWLQLIGAAGVAFSLVIIYLTFRENAYLSTVVRIQEDRGQRVVSTGPYSYVRHPMYAGVLLLFPSATILLGSWYGFAVALALDSMFVVRTVLEERVLRVELAGYPDYVEAVRYRIIPRIW